MRRRIAALTVLLSLALAVGPVAAVTRGGAPDAGEHPMVGQLLFYVPDAANGIYEQPGGWFSCSGTLVSPTVVVTAGHCTFAIGLDGESTTTEEDRFTAADGNGSGGNDVWFTTNESVDDDGPDHWDGWPLTFDPETGDLNFPTEADRYAARSAWLEGSDFWSRATAYPHPEYDDRAFYLHDLGVLVLDEGIALAAYASVAPENYLERYAGRRNEHRFEVVGYGTENLILPFEPRGGDSRMKAEPKLNNLVSNPKKVYIQLSNNTRTGGTCFGDSGGPTFDTTDSLLLVGVTSFGLSPNCTGIGGAYRTDQPDDLEFLAEFGVEPAG